MAQATNQAEKKLESLRKARREIDDEMDAALEEVTIWINGEEDEKKARAVKTENDERDSGRNGEASPTRPPSAESRTFSRRGREDTTGGQPRDVHWSCKGKKGKKGK